VRRNVIRFALCAMLFTLCVSAEAQQPKKVARIGFLAPATRTGYQHLTDAFLQGLRELGYAEGQNIVIEYRWADGNFERLPELAAELVRLKVDVIVAAVTQASLAAKNATETIPIVMLGTANPVDSGLVASLARPGGNITGTSLMVDEVVGKHLALLKEILPKISRIGVIWNPANPVFQKLQLRAVDVTARELNVGLQKLEARDPVEIERAFAATAKEATRALVILSDPLFVTHRKQIANLALKHRLPAATGPREYAESGLLMSYGPIYPDSFRRAAIYVDKILKGAKPADLPVERPTKFELVINLKTAKQIGLTIPQSVLFRADKVIR
jgi:putative ABC transport system substrate-binding protein